jgi:hypothetical protein
MPGLVKKRFRLMPCLAALSFVEVANFVAIATASLSAMLTSSGWNWRLVYELR